RLLPPEPRRGSAPLHQRPPVSLQFARLPRGAACGNAVGVGGQGALLQSRERRGFWRTSDKKHPGAPPPDNRLTHQTRAVAHGLRTLRPDVAEHVPLLWPPNAHQKFSLETNSQLLAR